jgi:hypothetical protein
MFTYEAAMSENSIPPNVGSKFWRERAADMRALSQGAHDDALKRLFLQMAEDYEALAVQRDTLSKQGSILA